MDYKAITDMVLNFFVNIPFPFNSILKKQLESATIAFDDSKYNNGYYYLSFVVDNIEERFPAWLDKMPLSFQIIDRDAPIEFLLYVDSGKIDTIEIINYAFQPIQWNLLNAHHIVRNFNYDEESIVNEIKNGGNIVNKMRIDSSLVDIDLHMGVVSFRGCNLKTVSLTRSFLSKPKLKIESISDSKYRYHIYLNDEDSINFKCVSLFQRYHLSI